MVWWRIRPMRRLQKLEFSLRTALVIGVIVAVAATAMIVHVPWLFTSRQNISELNARLADQVIKSIAGRVTSLLEEAVATRQAIASIFANGVVDINEIDKRNHLLLSILRGQPHLAELDLAWPDDRSVIVLRNRDTSIEIVQIAPAGESLRMQSEVFRESSALRTGVAGYEDRDTDYRASAQFWYRTAFDVDQPVWSNIYPLPMAGGFGVATTQTIERDGMLLGVLAVVISLDRLSSFLNGIEITPGSAVFMTNTAEQLVAIQDKMAVGSAARPPANAVRKLDASTVSTVRMVASALRSTGTRLAELHEPQLITFDDDASGETYFVTLAPLSEMGLVVGIVVPERDVLGAVNRNNRLLLILLTVFLIVMVVVSTRATRLMLGRPLELVAHNLRQLENFEHRRIRPIPSRLAEIRQVSEATARMSASLTSFGKFIPVELVRTLFEQGVEAVPGGEQRELTVMFIDLANFTHISEALGNKIIAFLSDYLKEMSRLIQLNHGTIDKYMGDGIMAFWGAPLSIPDHAREACRAALACQMCLKAIRAERVGADPPQMRARIGINTGEVLVGNFGSDERLNYTVVGDKVNVASRLETLNRMYGTEIIIGEETYVQTRNHIVVRFLDKVAVYGKDEQIRCYELLAMRENASPDMAAWIGIYEEAHARMSRREWDEALALFRDVIALRGGADGPSSTHIARILTFKTEPPPADWDASITLGAK